MFKKRINSVLSGRKMHVWGESIGLRGTLISNMFSSGKIPGPKQLTKIAKAENVRVDWLLGLDDGAPYKTRRNLEDAASAMHIKNLVSHGYEPVLLLDDTGHACVVATKRQFITYDDDTEARFTDVEILPNIGEESVAALKDVNAHYSLVVRTDIFSKITHGWISAYELTKEDGILSKKERVYRTEQISKLVEEYAIENSSTEDIIRRSGQLKMAQQAESPLTELYVLLDVMRYLDDERYKSVLSYARELAAQQLANEYTENVNNTTN